MRKYAVMCTLLFLLGASGCSGIHMYNAENHEMAKMAKESFEKANIDEIVKQEYDLNEEMTKQRLEVSRQLIKTKRNTELIDLINSTQWWSLFNQKIKNRLTITLGKYDKYPLDTLRVISNQLDLIKDEEADIAIIELRLKAFDKTQVNVTHYENDLNESKKNLETNKTELNEKLKKYPKDSLISKIYAITKEQKDDYNNVKERVKNCTNSYKKAISYYNNATSDIGKTATSIEAVNILKQIQKIISTHKEISKLDEKDKKQAQASLAELVVALKTSTQNAKVKKNRELGAELIKDYTQYTHTPTTTTEKKLLETIATGYKSESKQGNITAFTWVISYYMDQLSNISTSTSGIIDGFAAEGKIKKYQLQLDAINKSLKDLGNEDTLSKVSHSTPTYIKIALSIDSISKHYARTKTVPTASALKLEAERLKLELQEVKQRHSQSLELIELYNKKLQAVTNESVCLIKAANALQKVSQKLKTTNNTIAKSIKESPKTAEALHNYIESWTIWRTNESDINNKIVASNYNTALNSANIALQQWNSLIAVPLDRLEAYHASGITNEQMAYFLQALGIGAIAVK